MNKRIVAFAAALLAVAMLSAQNAQFKAYISRYKDLAIEQMQRYDIPASITLAQALLESDAGQSELARESNNHFGIKCHKWSGQKTYHDDDERDDCFRVYKTVRDSYEDHSLFLVNNSRYASLFRLDPTDYAGWAHGLKLAGYATDGSYAESLIRVIETYKLDRFDSDSDPYLWTMEGTSTSHTPQIANGLLYVVARQGDTLKGIAEEFGTTRWKLIHYNDLYRNYVPEKGDILYLHRKHWRAQKPYKEHVVKEGESMYSISQMYGIRLNWLYRMNRDKGDVTTYSPLVGDVIRLR